MSGSLWKDWRGRPRQMLRMGRDRAGCRSVCLLDQRSTGNGKLLCIVGIKMGCIGYDMFLRETNEFTDPLILTWKIAYPYYRFL